MRIVNKGKNCTILDCQREAHKRGWCQRHYDRWRAHGDPNGGRPLFSRTYVEGQTCEVEGCGGKIEARGWCLKHYSSWRKHGDPLEAKHRWKHNRRKWHVETQGYVWRHEPASPNAAKVNGYVFQHRDVMSRHIGRPLRKGENVHHKNGNRADNRIENLELWVSGQPPGQRIQDRVHWAREILREYGDLVDRML